MLTYKCDFCGKECESAVFVVPVWQDCYGGKGNMLLGEKLSIVTRECNICDRCRQIIANSTYKIKKDV